MNPVIRLGPLAATMNEGPLFLWALRYPSLIVGGSGIGIQCVAEVVQHEQEHVDVYKQFDGQPDTDGDRIPDGQESFYRGIMTDPYDPDTYRISDWYPESEEYGDQEIRCMYLERETIITVYPEHDWANPGCQHYNQWGPKVGQ